MTTTTDAEAFCFEGFTLDLVRGCLCRDAQVIELRPKSFAMLCHLVRSARRLVPKDELIEAVWPHVVVTDDSLARCVSDLRRALGDAQMRLVKTVPRRGYLLDTAVTRTASSSAIDSSPATDRPSIAVLPLSNLSGDAHQDYLCDGLTEDLITLLSSVPDLHVIASHSAFAYKAQGGDARAIGSQLGVRYLLQGSLRADTERLRITAHLVDAASGHQLWAEHYDRAREDVFALQDQITQRIVASLVARVGRSELARALRKPTDNLVAYDHYLRGAAVMENLALGHRAEGIPEARRLFNLALAADPGYSRPLVSLAQTHFLTWVEPVEHGPLRSEFQLLATLDHAVSLAQRAVDLDALSAKAHACLGHLLHWRQRRAQGMAEFERAFELNPNLCELNYMIVLTHDGRAAEAIAFMERCRKLDPFYPPRFDSHLAHAHYLLGHNEVALRLLRGSVRRKPSFQGAHAWHAAAAAQLGHDDEARAALAQLAQFQPQLTITKFLGLLRYAQPADAERMAEGLRKAGLRE
ncbi:winged helix-turn-helix domain-containing protein [Variovorax sp. J22R133]|uniref:winged helix-turn-helix domain-containing tetratricopeptide repeat protein n=1 Tax=Variovorax brevis TaxID=3053503 RepID=UPI0025789F9B|nr:winged helix-turn-helix domain-containing protein [Variovorax sp. J22R133]MDM0117643.1 winged helix-turn-helix domain-containing protein [Variovorax sp. J22R133]